MEIVIMPEDRTSEGFANSTRCKCGLLTCDNVIHFNGEDRAVKTDAGFIQLLCAVRLGLITRAQAMVNPHA
jgi:hypothetical protein